MITSFHAGLRAIKCKNKFDICAETAYSSDMRKATGEQLRKLREECGLTITKAACLSYTPRRTWQRWEQRPDSVGYAPPPGLAFAFLLRLKFDLLVPDNLHPDDYQEECDYYEELFLGEDSERD